ncbi:hypothetical protein PPYR_13818 [Photinus pyralis]|uniref:Dynein regulatory complex subunit 2 n=1 Tax=Photinus pyralis TaxID=7054 RepID=A0A5N4AAC0_PHOPY|nr:dynein regulatory complex subunit 2 [Photinus pyralis]KAB0794198.1 hypothetical protein PPYR_13818 [Photinus pyralis]
MGKKKAGLANRLARMSDDERAKYLQRKADAEEEARRRKEQLVENFMKNKLKREDGFSRLNVAKINQYWHQVMRAEKCEHMKKDVEHLRRWMHRTVIIKNGVINKLMEELDWQEELYGKNFEAHTKNINNLIDFHNKNLKLLLLQYTNDRQLLLYIGSNERREMEEKYINEIEHLKTIIYGQEVLARNAEEEAKNNHMKFADEEQSQNRMELRELQKEREKVICRHWNELYDVIKNYIEQTDLKRLHMVELQRNDTRGLVEVSRNEAEIQRRELELRKLHHEESMLASSQAGQLKHLQKVIEVITQSFFRLRKGLQRDISHDERQLAILTTTSNNVIDALSKIVTKGHQLMHLVKSCQKLDPPERGNQWERFEEEPQDESNSSSSGSAGSPVRPKTSPPKRPQLPPLRQLRSEDVFVVVKPVGKDTRKTAKRMDLVAEAQLIARRGAHVEGENRFRDLNQMEGLWWIYNKVELGCADLRSERNTLVQENNKLKERIRDVLEAAALGQSIPNVKSASTVLSRKRYAFSAPTPSRVC